MTNVNLWVNGEGWKSFDLTTELGKAALIERKISIGDGASIGNRAIIGNEASIGNRASIGDGASIGNRAIIGNGAIIGDGASIGNRAIIGDGASIGDEASIGYRVSIGDGASIGENEKPKTIFISGSKHVVNYWGQDLIAIGCHQRTISNWLETFKQVGEEHDYTPEQIEEYGNYIKFISELHKLLL